MPTLGGLRCIRCHESPEGQRRSKQTQEAAENSAIALDATPGANVAAKAIGAGLVGTPTVIADRIRRYEDCGIDCLMLQFHPMKDGLQQFAHEIMPRLRR